MKGFRQPPGGLQQAERDFRRAFELQSAGRETEAEVIFVQILRKCPSHFGSLYSLGILRFQQGRPGESLVFFRKAIAGNPGSHDAHHAFGNALQALARHEEAIQRYQCALALRHHNPHVYNNLGNSYQALGRMQEAEASFRQAIALAPHLDVTHNNLGNVLLELGQPYEALAAYEAALALNPGLGALHANLGKSLVALNRHEEAVDSFVHALELDDVPQSRLNLALTRLALGDYPAGWRDYEARWNAPHYSKPRAYPQPLWNGRAELSAKTILLYFEQGLGDTIQFARYVPLVAQTGARVMLQVQKPLLKLFGSLAGPSVLLPEGDPLPDFDFHAPLLSLPLAFQTTLENIPAKVPYLHAAPVVPSRVPSTSPSIGLCWAGSPDNPTDRDRSIPLSTIAPLLEIAGVHFVSLQKVLRPGDEEILARYGNVDVDSIRNVTDFADTAALVAGLDLLIAVDTSMAHLAGALARPVWVLLKYSAHWAWLREREDSPWYPTARLFRQPQPGDWQTVIAKVRDALHASISQPRLPQLENC